ncbi:MAG: hypothetical protein HY817_00175 [Candidatus Abawacabacteria bacterium]|nr:hypothetical protein [Candidatus Abawacabacteria bacterium]
MVSKIAQYQGTAGDFLLERKVVIEEPFLLGRLGAHLILMPDGQRFVLKTDKIESTQLALLRFATEHGFDSGCRLPQLHAEGQVDGSNWIVLEHITAPKIASLIDTEPQRCIDTVWEMAQGYQRLLASFLAEHPIAMDYEKEKRWLFEKIQAWGAPIVKAGLMEQHKLESIYQAWAQLVEQHGTSMFAAIHGNMHGDHTFLPATGSGYVVDPVCWYRPGRAEYYDWVRALDWMILKAKDPKQMFSLVIKNISTRLSHVDKNELHWFLALRGLGALGADMLANMDTPAVEAAEERRNCFLKLITGEY